MTCPSISAQTPLVFHPTDNQAYALNFTQFGIGSRTISSATASVLPASGAPTIANLAANAGTIPGEGGQTVAIGKAVTFDMSGGTAGVDYTITIKATLSDGDVMNGVFLGQCRSS